MKGEPSATNLTIEADMTKMIKSLAVISLQPSVHVVSLHEMKQQSGENVQTFAARLRDYFVVWSPENVQAVIP